MIQDLHFTTATTEEDLAGILILQRQNLSTAISASEAEEQGFLTVVHDLDILKKMNALEQHVVGKDKNKVIG